MPQAVTLTNDILARDWQKYGLYHPAMSGERIVPLKEKFEKILRRGEDGSVHLLVYGMREGFPYSVSALYVSPETGGCHDRALAFINKEAPDGCFVGTLVLLEAGH